MRRLIKLFVILSFLIVACATKEKIVVKTKPLTTPPEEYKINQMNSSQDLIYEYRRAIIKISEWQTWYDINAETNHFRYSPTTNGKTNR